MQGVGSTKDSTPKLYKAEEARPKEHGYSGDRATFNDFRADVVNWASSEFAQVDSYLDWAYGQTQTITDAMKQVSGFGSELDVFDRQFRRELWSFLKEDSEARESIKHTKPCEGLEAWRCLS